MPTDYAAIDALIVRVLTPRGWEFEDPEYSECNGRIVGNWSDLRALVEAAQAELLPELTELREFRAQFPTEEEGLNMPDLVKCSTFQDPAEKRGPMFWLPLSEWRAHEQRMAALDAALKDIAAQKPRRGEQPTWDEALVQKDRDGAAAIGWDCAAWDLCEKAEVALSGGTPALDAATAELREKCEALAARNAELENAFAQDQSMSCFYCGLNVARDGKSKEEFDAEWQQHIHECDKRPEAKLVSFICWLIAENNIENPLSEKFPGLYDQAHEQTLRRDRRQRLLGAAEELNDAASEMDARKQQGIDFTPGDLRARAAELNKLAEEGK